MAFKKISPPVRKAYGGGTGVKATVRISKSPPAGTPSVGLSISKVWVDKFKAHSPKWQVLEGEGDDAGYLRLSPSPIGEFAPRLAKGGTFCFTLGELECAPLKAQEVKWCEAHMDPESGELVIRLPSWAFPGTSFPSDKPAVAKVPVTPVRRVLAPIDVPLVQGSTGPCVNLGEPPPDYAKRRAEAEARGAEAEKQKPPINGPSKRKGRDFSAYK